MSGQVAFFRFAAALSLLGVTVLGAAIATIFDHNPRSQARAAAFGVGVLLAISLVATLPSAAEHLGSSSWSPAAYVLVALSFILSIAAEHTIDVLSVFAKHVPVPAHDDVEVDEEQEHMLSSGSVEMSRLDSASDDDSEDLESRSLASRKADASEREYPRPSFQPHFITVAAGFALCFHAFSRGVAIGAYQHRSLHPLLADISMAFVASVALASLVLSHGTGLLQTLCALLGSYPLGIVLGAVSQAWPMNVTLRGMLQTMSCGMLLYVVCTRLVATAFKDRTDGAWKLVCLSAGFVWAVSSIRSDQALA